MHAFFFTGRALAGGLLLAAALPAMATDFSATVDAASPVFTVTSVPLGGVGGCGLMLGQHPYEAQSFVALTTGAHAVTTTALAGMANDNFIALYEGVFNPAAPTQNLVGCNDDAGLGPVGYWSAFSAPMTAGQAYTVVFTAYGDASTGAANTQGTGTFRITPDVSLAYAVGGTLSGLASGSIVLRNNGGDDLTLSANGNFAFAGPLADGAAYDVTIATEPADYACTVSNGSGTIASANADDVEVSCVFDPAPPEGVNLASTAPVPVYARELIATPASPVVLDNAAGDLNLSTPLGYNFSPNEVRYARVECAGVVFANDAEVEYVGAGSAATGAVNGRNSSVITFSLTAADPNVADDDLLTVTGGRSITGTAPVNCTYGLYDYPSQAQQGGTTGRVATRTGDYLTFAGSTSFATVPRTSVADVSADPAYSAFVPDAPTSTTTAALARLTYGLAADVPLEPDGTAIDLSDLHAAGTRIVVTGDFGAAANADGTFSGDALDRVFLGTTAAGCAFGTPATTLSATQAVFAVGATATDRMLCLTPRAGVAIPVAGYSAALDVVPADPGLYAVDDAGPEEAGRILHSGTELQAPLAQVPAGWKSRLVLTNTGNLARSYAIAVTGEAGRTFDTDNLTGTVPAHGTVVIDLGSVMRNFNGSPRATLNVTVEGPGSQIQGLYQIVNPAKGSISNHVLVRPGLN